MRSNLSLVLALLVSVGACNGDDEDAQPGRTQRQTAARDSVVREPVYPEAEAAQILRAINAGEVSTSRVASARSQNDDVLRYASVMIADHSAMTALLDSLLPPISDSINAESRAIAAANTALVDTLWKLEGGFNNTYIQHQIAAHERTVTLLDTALIPSARNPRVRKLLHDLRPAVVAHLRRAQQIWTERQKSGAAAATARAATPRPVPATTAPAPAEPPRDTAVIPDPAPITTTSNM
jgi:predicted outer membrane protein